MDCDRELGFKISNGIIIQWGTIVNTTQTSMKINLALSYTTKNYSVVASDWSSPTVSPYVVPCGVYYNNNTTSSFNINFANNQKRGFGWISIGY